MSSTLQKFLEEIQTLDTKVGSINVGQILFLMELMKKEQKIKRVLETGFHTGISAATFLDTRPDVQVVSFDIFWFDYTRKAKLILDKYYPRRNLLIAGNTMSSLSSFFSQKNNIPFDLVFIDGGHEWPIPFYDLQIILSQIQEGTFVIIDDYCEAHGQQGVIRAVDEIIQLGLLSDIQYVSSQDRQMVFAKRSAVPFSPSIPDDEIYRLLQETHSHYDV
jgi:predicted O-methyltransferase YrrM